MATRSGGSRGGRSSGRSGGRSGGSRSGSRRASSSSRRASSSSRRTSSSRKSSATRRSTAAAGRADKSVEQFREALERSVTLSRDRLQETVDDLVKRGRIQQRDANELVSNIVSRGRRQRNDLIKQLERLRRDLEGRVAPARRQARSVSKRAERAAIEAADRPLAEADRLRRRAGVPGGPITAYDRLSVPQIKTRLKDLSTADLRKVRTQEKRGKGRKGILDDIERRLT